MRRLSEGNGSIVCGELLGVDISTPGGWERFTEQRLLTTRCLQFVRNAVRIIQEIV